MLINSPAGHYCLLMTSNRCSSNLMELYMPSRIYVCAVLHVDRAEAYYCRLDVHAPVFNFPP